MIGLHLCRLLPSYITQDTMFLWTVFFYSLYIVSSVCAGVLGAPCDA